MTINQELLQTVAIELAYMGFITNEWYVDEYVHISLGNRKVSQMEVETALEQKFGEIKFNLSSDRTGVIVRL